MSTFGRLLCFWAGFRRVAPLLVAVLMIGAPAALAAEEATAGDATPAEAVPAPAALFADYYLQVGDRVQVSVWGEPDLTTDTALMPDGTLSLPLVGTLQLVGKTVPAVREELTEAYSVYLKDPRISLSCIPQIPLQVYLDGSVSAPGRVRYDPRFRLLDYLRQVGGPAPDADLSNVVITSVRGSEVTTTQVDLRALSPTGDPLQNPPLKPGDTVWVGKALPIAVIGAVNNPGSLDYRRDMRLSDYVGRAGGPTIRANLEKAMLKHDDGGEGEAQAMRINLAAALKQPDSSESNPILSPGDVVTVPEKFLAGGLSWSDILRAVTSVVVFWQRG